jgi:DNA replication protein DnaC
VGRSETVALRNPTIADGILGRVVHNAHRVEMRGESMRKKRNPSPDEKKE